jgi:hypothetical protein
MKVRIVETVFQPGTLNLQMRLDRVGVTVMIV